MVHGEALLPGVGEGARRKNMPVSPPDPRYLRQELSQKGKGGERVLAVIGHVSKGFLLMYFVIFKELCVFIDGLEFSCGCCLVF